MPSIFINNIHPLRYGLILLPSKRVSRLAGRRGNSRPARMTASALFVVFAYRHSLLPSRVANKYEAITFQASAANRKSWQPRIAPLLQQPYLIIISATSTPRLTASNLPISITR